MHVSALRIVNTFAHIVLTLILTPSPANLPIVLLTLRSKETFSLSGGVPLQVVTGIATLQTKLTVYSKHLSQVEKPSCYTYRADLGLSANTGAHELPKAV